MIVTSLCDTFTFISTVNLLFKDQCATCCLFMAIVEPSEKQREEYEDHVIRKDTSRAAMRRDIKNCATDPE